MAIEHTGVLVSDIQRSRTFYEKALAPLGYAVHYDFTDAVGFMEGGHTSFWIGVEEERVPMHIAFAAKDRQAVQDFYDAALAAGGKDNGKPGPRPDYSPDYYAAYILDPDGNNIEAVCYV